jgi:CspA family cold shock protein
VSGANGAERQTGVVKFWKDDKGWGFIMPDTPLASGKDIFVHKTEIGALPNLLPDQRVSFEVRSKPGKGEYASRVKVV